jgi:hypothetical protein
VAADAAAGADNKVRRCMTQILPRQVLDVPNHKSIAKKLALPVAS